MQEFYEAELRLLHDSAKEFAEAYPEQAGMLNLNEVKDRDPYVERLLEGMAYLTAQIRQHINDDIPEISETLLNQLWPHFLRPYPSTSIAKFEPRIGQLQQTQIIEKKSTLLSKAIGEDNIICRFRTSNPVKLNPVQITQLNIQESAGGGSTISLTFELDSGVNINNLDLSDLKIYLHADPAIAIWLHYQLCKKLTGCRVLFPQEPNRTPDALKKSVCAAHLNTDDALIEMSGRSFHGFHLLQDYFCFREKYLFITLQGLDTVSWKTQTDKFVVEFRIADVCPSDHNLSKDNFLLHCSPIVNLFELTSEPINLTHKHSDYPVIADVGSREGVQVYSVNKVTGIDSETGDRHQYFPMYTFEHRRKGGRYYHNFRRSVGTGRTETHLTLGGTDKFNKEVLSCDITATNAAYPRRYLKENEITTQPADFPSFASFTNLIRPGAMLTPPERDRFQWELISHLSLNYNSLAELDTFKRVLKLYDWTRNEQNRRRIDGVQSINVSPIDRIKKGALMRGLKIKLTIHEEHYRSIADIHLFGLVIHHFFSMYATINCFVQTEVLCHPSNEVIKWEPLIGENTPI